jgi:hypothetical protein
MRTNRLAKLTPASAALALLLAASVSAPAAGAAAPTRVIQETGYNYYGELGLGPSGPGGLVLPQTLALPQNVVQVSSDYYGALARLSDGSVWGWGGNEKGMLGDGTTEARLSPVQIPALAGVRQVSLGYYHGIALTASGEVLTWGNNEGGELGTGGAEKYNPTPKPVPGLSGVKSVTASCYVDYAVMNGGTVEAWGANSYGEVGDGTQVIKPKPVPIPGLTEVESIAAGCNSAYALLHDGTVRSWGDDEYGQVGDGKSGSKRVVLGPVSPGLSGVAQVGGGDETAVALLASGQVLGWGHNSYGEIPGTKEEEHDSPVPIPGATGVKELLAGGYFTYARLANGSILSWGYGDYGELGGPFAEPKAPALSAFAPAGVGFATGDGYTYAGYVIEAATGSLSSPSLAFGSQPRGLSSTAQTVTVKNEGPAALAISGEAFTGTGAGSFTKAADSCQGATLAVGASCSVAVTFKPAAPGAIGATLAIASSAPTPLSLALSGTATARVAPKISKLVVSPASFRAAHSGPSAIGAASSGGAYVVWQDSQAAAAEFAVQQSAKGLTNGRGHTCGKAPRHPKKHSRLCTFWQVLGTFKHTDVAGTNALRFTGRAGGHALKRGAYRLSIRAASVQGTGPSSTASFTITG